MDDRSAPEPVDLPEDLIHLVKPELQPGERLLWASHAGAGSPSTISWPSWSLWIWFFGIIAIGLGCFAALPSSAKGHLEGTEVLLATVAILSAVVAILFVVGFFGSVAGKLTERKIARAQSYALTDRRAMIWVPQPGQWVPRAGRAVSVHTFQRGTIKGEDLHRVQYPDGSGDVLFRVSYQQPSGFLGIADVRRIEELVRRFLVIPGQRSNSIDESHLD
jgi:hypothetical protein